MHKLGSKQEDYLALNGISTISRLNNLDLPRRVSNRIVKLIPASLTPLMLDNFEYGKISIAIGIESNNKTVIKNLFSVSSTVLQLLLKRLYKKIIVPNIYHVHKIENNNSGIPISWSLLWSIKHPCLRAIRYKFMHRDIYSMERLCRYGLSNDKNCIACGEVETVSHLMYDCPTSKILWGKISKICGRKFNSYKDLLILDYDPLKEILICCAIKCLIQVDRLKAINFSYYTAICNYYLTLESNSSNVNNIAKIKYNLNNLK